MNNEAVLLLLTIATGLTGIAGTWNGIRNSRTTQKRDEVATMSAIMDTLAKENDRLHAARLACEREAQRLKKYISLLVKKLNQAEVAVPDMPQAEDGITD